MDPLRIHLNALWGPPGRIRGSMGPPGVTFWALVEPSGASLGSAAGSRGPFRDPLGLSQGSAGGFWGALGRSGTLCDFVWGAPGASDVLPWVLGPICRTMGGWLELESFLVFYLGC